MNEHGELITAAAREVLRPIGCVQQGRSRVWLDDHGWWVAQIEFQPSSWSRGSYLNVGACWLWSESDYLSFDEGYRVESFREFTDAERFAQSARELAERAKEETLLLRSRFASIGKTAAFLGAKKTRDEDIRAHVHAGVSAGLVGWTDRARVRLEAAMRVVEHAEWVRAVKRHCEGLLLVVDDTPAFRGRVSEIVGRNRQALRLEPWPSSPQAEF